MTRGGKIIEHFSQPQEFERKVSKWAEHVQNWGHVVQPKHTSPNCAKLLVASGILAVSPQFQGEFYVVCHSYPLKPSNHIFYEILFYVPLWKIRLSIYDSIWILSDYSQL